MIIYKITNLVNGKVYIGYTKRELQVRWRQHCTDALKGSRYKFHRAIVKYGIENFKAEIVCSFKERKTAVVLETYYIKRFDSVRNGYNMTEFGGMGGNLGPEVAAKISRGNKGKKRSDKFKKAVGERMRGNTYRRGCTMPESARIAIAAAHRGKPSGTFGKKWKLVSGNRVYYTNPKGQST